MKFRALILFIAFAAFTSEKMVLPLNCMSNKKTSKCTMCCKMKKDKGICGNAKTKSTKKESNSSQCTDCPLCMIMMHSPINNFQATISIIKRAYSVARTEIVSNYFHAQWKPPNDFLSLS